MRRSKNFNDELKKVINGYWPFAHIKLAYKEKPSPKLVREYRSRSDDRSIEVTIESPDVELGLEWLEKIHGDVRKISRRVKASGGPELGYSVKLFQPTD